jgi:hypothetical protein
VERFKSFGHGGMAERKSSKHNIRKGLVDILTSLEFVKVKKVKKKRKHSF